MPTPAIPSGPRGVTWRFPRIMRWMSLACILVAGIAVWLAARGEAGGQAHKLILIALGAGLSVLLVSALIMLALLGPGRPSRRRPVDAEGEIQA